MACECHKNLCYIDDGAVTQCSGCGCYFKLNALSALYTVAVAEGNKEEIANYKKAITIAARYGSD